MTWNLAPIASSRIACWSYSSVWSSGWPTTPIPTKPPTSFGASGTVNDGSPSFRLWSIRVSLNPVTLALRSGWIPQTRTGRTLPRPRCRRPSEESVAEAAVTISDCSSRSIHAGYFSNFISCGAAIITSPSISTALCSNAAMKPVNRLATTMRRETDIATAAMLRRMIRRLRRYFSQRNSFNIRVQDCHKKAGWPGAMATLA